MRVCVCVCLCASTNSIRTKVCFVFMGDVKLYWLQLVVCVYGVVSFKAYIWMEGWIFSACFAIVVGAQPFSIGLV